jgi:hypothetical protein
LEEKENFSRPLLGDGVGMPAANYTPTPLKGMIGHFLTRF